MERTEYSISGRCKDYCKNEKCGYVWINAGSFHQGTVFDEETAAFIVRACNSHYELVEALATMVIASDDLTDGQLAYNGESEREFIAACEKARAALAKAKGEA